MKIAFTGNIFPFGEGLSYGGERICYYLLRELAKRGHDIYLFGVKGCSVPSHYIKDFIPIPELDGRTDFHLDAVQKYIKEKGIAFDVYQCNYFTDGWRPEALEIAPVYAELVWCAWCHILWQMRKTPYNTVSYSKVLHDLMKGLGAPTTMIHYGLPKEDYELSLEHDDYVVWIGKVDWGKAPKLAIELALAAGLKIVMMGPPYNPNCTIEQIMPYVDNDKVFWLRGVDDVMKKRVMSRAKAFISSNTNEWREMFGIVNIEALACGTPVVAFTKHGNPSAVKKDNVIRDGENGFLLEYNDSNNLQEILDKGVPLLNRLSEIDRADCRKSFEDEYTSEIMAARWEFLYQHILNNGNVESLELPF